MLTANFNNNLEANLDLQKQSLLFNMKWEF